MMLTRRTKLARLGEPLYPGGSDEADTPGGLVPFSGPDSGADSAQRTKLHKC